MCVDMVIRRKDGREVLPLKENKARKCQIRVFNLLCMITYPSARKIINNRMLKISYKFTGYSKTPCMFFVSPVRGGGIQQKA